MLENYLNIEFLNKICKIAVNAGKAVMDIYKEDFKVDEKMPNHPITKADLNSHFIIQDSLKDLIPDTFFLSEESENIDWETRKNWKKYWLVDPLDGTKEFIHKNGEFTVNIALIEESKPVLGVVFAPAFSKIYFASKGVGCFLSHININESSISLEPKKLSINNYSSNQKTLKIISSRSHKNNNKMESWLKLQNQYELKYSGSSIKFCLIAEGEADIYPRFRPTCEWDTAAGHSILKEAGGNVKDLNGMEILYNKKDSIINPEFIASRF